MEEKEIDVKIDYQLLAKQFADKMIEDFISSLMPDEKTKKFWLATIAVHRQYGIDAATSIKILQELAEITKEE